MVSATLRKQTDLFNRGPSALPLRIIDDEELTPFRGSSEIREFMDESTSFHAVFMSSQDIKLKSRATASNSKVTDPFFCLRETIVDLWVNAHTRPEVGNVLIRAVFRIKLFVGNIIIFMRHVFFYLHCRPQKMAVYI